MIPLHYWQVRTETEMKIDTDALDEIMAKINAVIPNDFKAVKNNVEKNVRVSIESVLQRLDLVSREEFDIQASMLEKSQLRVQQLEQRIQQLEDNLLKK